MDVLEMRNFASVVLPTVIRFEYHEGEKCRPLSSAGSVDRSPRGRKGSLTVYSEEREDCVNGKNIKVVEVTGEKSSQSFDMTKARKITRNKSAEKAELNIPCRDLGKADHEGWLSKKAGGHGLVPIMWKRYWCVIKDSKLYLYKTSFDVAADYLIQVKEYTIENINEKKKIAFCMKPVSDDVKAVIFSGTTDEEVKKWMEILNKILSGVDVSQKDDLNVPDYEERKRVFSSTATDPPKIASGKRHSAFQKETETTGMPSSFGNRSASMNTERRSRFGSASGKAETVLAVGSMFKTFEENEDSVTPQKGSTEDLLYKEVSTEVVDKAEGKPSNELDTLLKEVEQLKAGTYHLQNQDKSEVKVNVEAETNVILANSLNDEESQESNSTLNTINNVETGAEGTLEVDASESSPVSPPDIEISVEKVGGVISTITDLTVAHQPSVGVDLTAQEPSTVEAELAAQEPCSSEVELVAQEPSSVEVELVAQEPSSVEVELVAQEPSTVEVELVAQESTTVEVEVAAQDSTTVGGEVAAQDSTTVEVALAAQESTTVEGELVVQGPTTVEGELAAQEPPTVEVKPAAQEPTTVEGVLASQEPSPSEVELDTCITKHVPLSTEIFYTGEKEDENVASDDSTNVLSTTAPTTNEANASEVIGTDEVEGDLDESVVECQNDVVKVDLEGSTIGGETAPENLSVTSVGELPAVDANEVSTSNDGSCEIVTVDTTVSVDVAVNGETTTCESNSTVPEISVPKTELIDVTQNDCVVEDSAVCNTDVPDAKCLEPSSEDAHENVLKGYCNIDVIPVSETEFEISISTSTDGESPEDEKSETNVRHTLRSCFSDSAELGASVVVDENEAVVVASDNSVTEEVVTPEVPVISPEEASTNGDVAINNDDNISTTCVENTDVNNSVGGNDAVFSTTSKTDEESSMLDAILNVSINKESSAADESLLDAVMKVSRDNKEGSSSSASEVESSETEKSSMTIHSDVEAKVNGNVHDKTTADVIVNGCNGAASEMEMNGSTCNGNASISLETTLSLDGCNKSINNSVIEYI